MGKTDEEASNKRLKNWKNKYEEWGKWRWRTTTTNKSMQYKDMHSTLLFYCLFIFVFFHFQNWSFQKWSRRSPKRAEMHAAWKTNKSNESHRKWNICVSFCVLFHNTGARHCLHSSVSRFLNFAELFFILQLIYVMRIDLDTFFIIFATILVFYMPLHLDGFQIAKHLFYF